ncbi:MAG: PP2C family protein-serine/threonine phosphatase [Chloroflexota bacterium]
MYYNSHNQREIYKLVEKLASGEFKSELDFLKSLVEDIVNHPEFNIIGGRVWALNTEERAYRLTYQYGNMKRIPDDYMMEIDALPVLADLPEIHTSLQRETDSVLLERGIEVYSVTGVGDLVKLGEKKFYKYLLGFNASEMMQSFFETLNIISSVATVALRDLSAKQEQIKLRRDLNKAGEIQRNLIPEHYLEFHDYKVYGVCIPDSDIGGDYFDYLKNLSYEEERLGILISDAASKGLSASIQALFVAGAVRMAQYFSPKISTMLYRLNTLIFKAFPYERFVTLFYCELTLSSNRLVVYANAGHCSPIHYRPSTDKATFLNPTGGLLGIVKEQKFRVENISMSPGDLLILYTDGIIEAQNKNEEFYGEGRIIEMARKLNSKTSKEIALSILEDVQKFSSENTYSDDRTLVVIKRDEV